MRNASAEEILEAARAQFEDAEVFEESGDAVSVEFRDNKLKEVSARQFRGVGLRVIHKGRIGFACTTDLRDPAKLVEMASASAAYGEEARFELPSQPDQVPTVETYDARVPEVSIDRMIEMGREALELSRQTNDSYLFACEIERAVGTKLILNSRGLHIEERGTGMSAHVTIQEVSDSGLLEVYEYKSWGALLDSVLDLTQRVLEKMKDASKVVPARLETMPMVFTPKALGNLLGPVELALNGKLVHKGASVLRGRIGQQVLDPRLTITDDPSIPFAPRTTSVDDEGLPARRQDIFTGGILRTYLADLQTAGLLGIPPTGHGSRGYGSLPAPAPNNLIVAPGDATIREMLGSMRRGLVIDQTLGSGQSNVLAGEFSVNVELGFLVENGHILGRIKDCMVAGNVYEVLKHVESIGSEQQWLGSRCLPPIMVSGLKLAAQG